MTTIENTLAEIIIRSQLEAGNKSTNYHIFKAILAFYLQSHYPNQVMVDTPFSIRRGEHLISTGIIIDIQLLSERSKVFMLIIPANRDQSEYLNTFDAIISNGEYEIGCLINLNNKLSEKGLYFRKTYYSVNNKIHITN